MRALTLRGVEKTYDGGLRALAGVDLDVAGGEQLAADRGELRPPHRGVHLDPARVRTVDGVRPDGRAEHRARPVDQDALGARCADVHAERRLRPQRRPLIGRRALQ